MPIHFKGKLISGRLSGPGEMYETNDDGCGIIEKGNFFNGKLHDVNGVRMIYDEKSIIQYEGSFIHGDMDGTINMIEYNISNDPNNNINDNTCIGNGKCGTRSLAYITAAKDNRILPATQSSIIYSSGIQGAVVSSRTVNVILCVTQSAFNDRYIFTAFEIICQ